MLLLQCNNEIGKLVWEFSSDEFFGAAQRWLNDVEQIQENDDGDGNPHKPQQNSTHDLLLVLKLLHLNHCRRVMVPAPASIFSPHWNTFSPHPLKEG
jgi:hypothetical protein